MEIPTKEEEPIVSEEERTTLLDRRFKQSLGWLWKLFDRRKKGA